MRKTIFILVVFIIFSPVLGEAENMQPADVTDSTLASLADTEEENAAREIEMAEEETGADIPETDEAESGSEGAEKFDTITRRTNFRSMKWNWDDLFTAKTVPEIFTYTIQPGDSLYVIAKKNHTTPELIKKLNGFTQDTIYAGEELKVYRGDFTILIDKSSNILTLFAGDKAIKDYRVSTGKDNSTPVGEFEIKDKLVNPTWFKTGAIYAPGSPDNQLGTRWLGFDKAGYGIHGTTEPQKIGRQVSEGCIRMLNEDVEELYSLVPTGTKVIIQN